MRTRRGERLEVADHVDTKRILRHLVWQQMAGSLGVVLNISH